MGELRALITCRQVWDDENAVSDRLAELGVDVDIPKFEGQQMEEEDLLPILYQYDGIMAGDDPLTRGVLESARRLKVISKWGIGVDAIDIDAAAELGIAVYNTPGVFGEELADYAMGFIHLLARRQHEVNARVKAGEWHKVRGTSLAGKTLGVVGLGSSGSALVRRGNASRMRVLGHDTTDAEVGDCERVSFQELMQRADILSLHVPLTPETRHMINSDSLSQAKRGAWLINVSRGGLVDETALGEALAEGTIGAAALDVFESEPVAMDNPLLQRDDVVVGSHNGSNTQQAVERTTRRAVDNLARGLGVLE